MAKINQVLLERLKSKLGISLSRVYALVDEKVRSTALPRNLAAIALAADRGINISKFASSEDLATIRQTAMNVAPAPVVLPGATPLVTVAGPGKPKRRAAKPVPRRRGTQVFVVHGRDLAGRDAVFQFLRAVGLRPLEWSQAVRLTRKGTPYVGEILDAAFRNAAAIVVLLTPDELAKLKPEFVQIGDAASERNPSGQARPNVLFEAGMAFGRNPDSTVLVQLGETRPFSDVGGRHVLRLADNPTSRQEFATKLANAGCNVDTSGSDWMTAGNFGVAATATKPRSKTIARPARKAGRL